MNVSIQIVYVPASGGFPQTETMIGNGQCPLQRARGLAFAKNVKVLSVSTKVGARERTYNMQVIA